MQRIFKLALLSKDKLVLEQNISGGATDELVSAEQIAAVLNSFGSLGYTLDGESVRLLAKLDAVALTAFYNENYIVLCKAKGADVEHRLFYPNFPDMAGITPDEYFLRAVLHYLTVDKDDYGFDNPDIPERAAKQVDSRDKTVLSIVTEQQADDILVAMASDALAQNLPIPDGKLDLYRQLWQHYDERIHPQEIPFKQNMALYVLSFFDWYNNETPKITYEHLCFCKTVTDVLRVYSAVTSGATDLVQPVYFASLPRSSRRALLRKLDELCHNDNAGEDFRRHEFSWKVAAELLHPYDFRKQYPTAFEFICMLRQGTLPQSFESRLETLLVDEPSYLQLLRTRPTEYVRRLDFMLRTFTNKAAVLRCFLNIIDGVSTNALYALWNYYLNRANLTPYRDFVFYHGRTIAVEVDETRREMPRFICDKVVELVTWELKRRFGEYPQRGKVFIADDMANYTVPTSARTSSGQIHTLNYGTMLSVDEGNEPTDFVRLFTHWHNKADERVDIDLSVELVSDDLQSVISLSWHNMSGGQMFDSYHSGDLTTAPDGASEFVDLNIAKAREFGRYALVCNYCYTGQHFADIPECFSGVMFMPDHAKEGKVFNPQFVKFKFDLAQHSNKNVAFVLDLETRKLIWMDTNIVSVANELIASDDYGMVVALRKVLQRRISVADWMEMHLSHLELTDNRAEADFVVDVGGNVDPTDAENFAVNWM